MRKKRKSPYKKALVLSTIFITAIFMASGYSILSKKINLTARANLYASERYLWKQIQNNFLSSSGSGFYKSSNENDKYLYLGNGSSNYISLDNSLWRIISIESDHTIKVIKWTDKYTKNFDEANNRTSSSTYCTSFQLGCNSFASQSIFSNGELTGIVENNSSILNYLNNDFYNTLSNDLKSKIVEHSFNVGPVEINDQTTFSNILTQEQEYSWSGYIGLPSISDYLYPSNIDLSSNVLGQNLDNNYLTNFSTNNIKWTINPVYNSSSEVWTINYDKTLKSKNAINNSETQNSVTYNYIALPIMYLKDTVKLVSGNGTEQTPFVIE